MSGTNIAIFTNDEVLLTLREDFEVWCLPGGRLDQGESIGQSAIREAREETGLDVQLTRFVGSYSRPYWPMGNGSYHIHFFVAEIIGGEITPQPEEVLDIRYFPVSDLPDAMLIGHRHQILDAAQHLSGVAKTELVEWPFPSMTWADIYHLKDNSDLVPAEFYQQHFPPLKPEQIIVDVAGCRVD